MPTTEEKDTKDKMKFLIPMVTKANLVGWETTDTAGDPKLVATIFSDFDSSN